MTLKELCETISCRNSEQMPSASSGNDHSPEGGSKIGRTQLHTHDYLELAYIVSGEFSQKILGKTITFREGELCLIDKNCSPSGHHGYIPRRHTVFGHCQCHL